ncbi:hypothetical protein CC1G_11141 [Coprinopsis cinerea okayama7|uniref:Uncharacterized protein n=1 Tax=Coprinopsis cinerea (strain Okayama-7 / 130 / ATCC MYA-4618 / FGSC 9003) TaxID=240176 RepID=A8N4S5_COPC7|nr:hypothetical protein CC1G_11141 [Coprinopsis cinerea okayama7\|eukprot:XP_001829871.2 hypothetical protein CC1G_11141 [Coprinopsis cinerea okayama7\
MEFKRTAGATQTGSYYPVLKMQPYMLENPGLANLDPAQGKRVFPKVFAIPLRGTDLEAWAKRHFPDEVLVGTAAHYAFRTRAPAMLPPEITRLVYVVLPTEDKTSYWESLALVIGSNLSGTDMRRAEDKELVAKVRKVLGVETPPGWHYFYTEY